jgi:hypothetical protein
MGSTLTTITPTIGEIWVYDKTKLYIIIDKDKHGYYDLLRIGDDSEIIHHGYDLNHWLQTDVWKKLE